MRTRVVLGWGTALVVLAVLGQSAQAGPIVSNPPGGPWYEFGFLGPGSWAVGMLPADPGGMGLMPSNGGNSIPADAPPWTWTWTRVACLTVTDAFNVGDILDIYDFGVSQGFTSVPSGGSGSGDTTDPDITLPQADFSSRVYSFGAGAHSITIQAAASPWGSGAAYFRLDIPEPSSLVLLSLGLVFCVGRRRVVA